MAITIDQATGSGGRVVYVDDVEPLVRMTARMLDHLGYEAHGFSSAAVALPFITDNVDSLSVVIADRSMPGMGGLELLESLSELPGRPPFILATALHAPNQLAQYERPGIEAVLAKPFTIEELDAVLTRVRAEPSPR